MTAPRVTGVGALTLAVGATWLTAVCVSLLSSLDAVPTSWSAALRATAAIGVGGLLWRASTRAVRELRTGLRLLAVGAALWGTAGIVRLVITAVSDGPVPGALALFYPSCGLLFAAGALYIGRGHARQIEMVRAIVDGLLIAAAVSLVWWKYFHLELDLSTEALTAIARTATDALFVAIATMIWSRSDHVVRRTTGWLAVAAVILFLVDLLYLGQTLSDGETAPLAIGWSAVMLFLALVALEINKPPRASAGPTWFVTIQQTAPLLAVLTVVIAIAASSDLDAGSSVPVVLFGAVALGLAGRQLLVARENSALHRDLIERARDLERLAETDELTGLSHRRVLIAGTSQALHDRRLDGGQVALVFVDLDGFKRINDRLGHRVGDRVLQVVAERLRSHASPGDIVSRFGGDEFAVLRHRADADIAGWADGFRRLLAEPIDLAGIRLRVTSSVGLVCADGSYADVERMLGDADLAMYRAKRAGSNQTAHFTLSLREAATDRARLAAELQRAITAHQLVVHYQPVIDLRDGRAVGAEALVRLVDPVHGLVQPDDFLPLAATLGLMTDITRVVLETACRDFATGVPASEGWWVSVNLGADESIDPQLCQRVSESLAKTGLAADRLVIEVSEKTLPESALRSALTELAGNGVRVALDDFGSGWSRFAQLRSLPLHMVKLDRDLTADLHSGGASALFHAVVALARELDLTVVAEGIEHPSQQQLARTAGCHLGQGYRWGLPASLAVLIEEWATGLAEPSTLAMLPAQAGGLRGGPSPHS